MRRGPAFHEVRAMLRWKKAGACLLSVTIWAACCPAAWAQSAVVDNGSDPDSRLNMREEPSTDSASLGRFYSGTQVEIVSDAGGGWSEVNIGGGQNSLSGYMMSEYLSEDDSGVLDATYDMQVISPYGTQSVVLRDRPSDSFDAVAMLEVGDAVRVIGTSGDFYYVQISDSSVGCLNSSELN